MGIFLIIFINKTAKPWTLLLVYTFPLVPLPATPPPFCLRRHTPPNLPSLLQTCTTLASSRYNRYPWKAALLKKFHSFYIPILLTTPKQATLRQVHTWVTKQPWIVYDIYLCYPFDLWYFKCWFYTDRIKQRSHV